MHFTLNAKVPLTLQFEFIIRMMYYFLATFLFYCQDKDVCNIYQFCVQGSKIATMPPAFHHSKRDGIMFPNKFSEPKSATILHVFLQL